MGILLDKLKEKTILVSDGAWGTFLYKRGLGVGECPESWNTSHAGDVYAIAESYVAAGADIILTNSFGGSPVKLAHFGLQDRAFELNLEAARISRKAAGKDCIVLGSIGPTGAMLMMGEVSEEEMYEGFLVQAMAMKDGGVDGFCVETMSALDEAVLAVKAAASTGLDVACTFTFNKGIDGSFKTMMGLAPADVVGAVKDAGAVVIGTNCGNGFDLMIDIVAEIRKIDVDTPVLVHANAGLPIMVDGQTVYPETAEMMAAKVGQLLDSGANIIGGCCGTTPDHIRAMAEAVRPYR
ncbi:MAG: homocysteine S-methyltransferase family protein [Spirochaetales bacterium]|nr:homocysteine S-methyltransferase family protein [Spirochaetales bacterium]